MTKEDKQLLLVDLCSRLPHGVKVYNEPYTFDLDNFEVSSTISKTILEIIKEGWKPYLRPMSSMTEEEEDEFVSFTDTMFRYGEDDNLCVLPLDAINWLNAHHFDYRGLIEKNLALDCTGLHMYNY